MRRPAHLRQILLWAAITAALLLALTASLTVATSFLGGKVRTADTIDVPASETVNGDLYLFGGTITVEGTVDGDLVVAGGTIRVDGPVKGDLLVGGGTIQVGGNVTGDARIGGGQVTITGNIGEDLLVGSGTLDLPGSVGQDLIFGSGTATVSGPVTGNILGSAGAYSRSGSVGGTESVQISRTQPASIAVTNPVLDAIRQWVVVLLFGALALWLLPRAVANTQVALERRTLLTFGTGILALVGYVIAILVIILAMVVLAFLFAVLTLGSLVGIELFGGILAILALTLGFIIGASFLADAVVGLAIGRVLLPLMGMRSNPDRWQQLGILAVGAALVVIVTSIPEVGWIAKLGVILFGLGAMLVAAWFAMRRRPVDPAAPVPPMYQPPMAPPEAPPPAAPA